MTHFTAFDPLFEKIIDRTLEILMTVPTAGETYTQLMEHLRKAQEASAMMAHLVHAQDDRELAKQWLIVSELFKKVQHRVTLLATRRLQ